MAFPGPAALGRGLVVEPDGDIPPAAREWPRLRIDDTVLASPEEAVDELDSLWRHRQPSVVELAVPVAELKQPETSAAAPYTLDPTFSFPRERLHYLVWVNRYDGRHSEPQWHHANRAVRLGATPPGDGPGDVLLGDGRPVWLDGGPRVTGLAVDEPVVHITQLRDAGSLEPDRWRPPGDELAPDQLAAVRHPGGPSRVLAPAGSGKTRVLTARLRHLLADRGWAPTTVTALAYNTRAAAEMRSRTDDLPGAQVRTLHSLGYEIIGRSQGSRPRLVDEREVRSQLERILRLRPRANDDVYAPYLEALAQVRSGLRPPEDVEVQREDVLGFAAAFTSYRQRLDGLGAIDFDEQIYQAVEVLLRDPETRRWAQSRCAHLLVDELQDLTPAQLLMIRLLAAPAYDVFGVGDDDQVIYGYAGADPRFLIDYPHYFPGAGSFLLEVNYRCPADVVDAASRLLSYNHIRVPKVVRAADGQEDASGLVVERRDETQLGGRLVELVQELLGQGAEPAEVAVLTRVNAGLLAPQVLLAEAGVPVGAVVDDQILGRTGMRAALAWLRLAVTAGGGGLLDGSDLAVVVRRPSRSLSPGLLRAVGNGTWSLNRLASFADGLEDARLHNNLSGFHEDIAQLAKLARGGATTAELLVEVRDAVGLGGSLSRLDRARSVSSSTHTDDLDALILLARAHPDPSDFETWLRTTLAQPRRPGPSGPDGSRPAAVVLSTVHRVKGLEWPYVVVWDASDRVFPHRLATTTDEQEEERRVFHVALTRAQRAAIVLARSTSPSPYLAELTGEAPVRPSRPARPSRSYRESKGADSAPLPSQKHEGQKEVVEALKEWRRQRAKDDGVPAYVVLHDRHLEGVARAAPSTLSELAACDGIGPAKLDRYGGDILAVISTFTDRTN